ncbi:MAG: hypothetical protein CVT62_13250 [Actinobacteria bacterium HGW-Actinobacteria-2]|nr:MAG: hypothetical protein CVT62_13250 [Actinobacteria bacterium HGW-Actinobacteria-2]
MDDDWYRSPGWSEADQEAFELRLARARAWNRPEYLRIKGLALAEAGLREAALGLWQRGLDNDATRSEQPGLLELMAEALLRDDPARAEQLLRRLLAEHPDLNDTTQMAEVALAEILIGGGSEAGLCEAYRLLDSWQVKRGSPFPANVYRWAVAYTRLAEAVGDRDEASEAAEVALSSIDWSSPFENHPGLGLVHADPTELEWLERLAADRRTDTGMAGGGRMDEFRAALAADQDYQQELAMWTAEDDAREAEFEEAELPLTMDLRAAGLDVDSVWDLGKHRVWPYPQALPVLMNHLERGGYPEITTDIIGQALAIKDAVAYWDRLRELYLTAPSPAQANAAAIAMSGCATSAQLAHLIEFLDLEERGQSRILFLRPINRLGREHGRAIIEGLRSHPVLGAEATAISKGRSRNS